MRHRSVLVLFALLSIVPTLAHAQDFGIMESAETIDRGNFKIRANPMIIFGKNGEARRFGAAVVVGYGFTDRFDAEGGVAFYKDVTFFGGNAEFWLVKRQAIDFSIAAGLHGRRGARTLNETGVDLTFLPSKHVNDRLDIYAGLDLAFESRPEKFGGGNVKTVHLVPGIEYKLNPDLDLVAEFGIALNDTARHYLSVGLAYYFR